VDVGHDSNGRLKQKIECLEKEVALLKQPNMEGQMMRELRKLCALRIEIAIENKD
jgi:hypothetical protein